MFVLILKTKSYIAVVLIVIFLAKFAAIDANGLNIIFSGSTTTFVNPYCKKNSSSEKSDTSDSFSQQNHFETQVITLSGNCTSPFQFEIFSWEADFSDPIVVLNEYFTSKLSYRYLDSISPPPRVA
ncbi:hypothetical protein [Gelidibacter pelagius]|uniref:hypothetical protein n=1 Tax=Gelidibacter pelagius TaxID=2819985 RepID=UPI001F3905BF|nr:hypothetical protein [Gelidibacter pelagius]